MPVSTADLSDDTETLQPLTELPFPPVTKQHILNCSYHSWYPRYRAITPKARLIPLSRAFIQYLRADGIVLPPEDVPPPSEWDSDSGIFSKDDEASDSDDEEDDPSAAWRDIHQSIASTIEELGGKVVPKLNWSAPKDATWINATNSMDCRTPNDIYLLLKSSDFVTHDLEHAFDGCVDDVEPTTQEQGVEDVPENHEVTSASDIPYHLVLRKQVQFNPAVEFRCFVRHRKLLGMCQRDPNHFDFLSDMQGSLRFRIEKFFTEKLKDTFPDGNFTFDVYIPPPHERVWLVDINPWAPRTDPLLFSWLELLTMPGPATLPERSEVDGSFVRLSLQGSGSDPGSGQSQDDTEDVEDLDDEMFEPELRLIGKDDPEALNFNSAQYSAHKMPRDVVEASQGGPGPLREFTEQWKEILERRQREEQESSDDER